MRQQEVFYRQAIEDARKLAMRNDLSASEKAQLDKMLKDIEERRPAILQAKAVDAALSDITPAWDNTEHNPHQKGGGMDLQSAYLEKGWDIQSKPSVSLGAVFGQKAMMADGTDAEIVNLPGISGKGADKRFAYPHFPATSLGDVTSVSFLQQTVRTFDPAGMDVPIAGSTQKSESVLTVALASQDALMIAHTTELVPNAIWNLQKFQKWISEELSFGLGQGIDFELLRALAAASGTTTHSQGTDTLFACYRNAVKVARAAGYNPNLAILHPNDSADLDLSTDDVSRFYGSGPAGQTGFPSLWGLKVVESISATEGLPILVDTQAYGELFFGALRFATNPYEEFRTNRTRGLLEVPMCLAIEQPAAIVEITLA